MYMEMKTVRDDATLLSEYVDELADDDEYMKVNIIIFIMFRFRFSDTPPVVGLINIPSGISQE